jgi:hypothetical protein
MLRRGELFFATNEELNDANELHANYVFNGHRKSWNRFVQLIFIASLEKTHEGGMLKTDLPLLKHLVNDATARAYAKFKRRDAKLNEIGALLSYYLSSAKKTQSMAGEILTGIEEVISLKIPSQLRQVAAIASFTKSATNPVIWGHYAAAGRGFCIIYALKDGSIKVETLSGNNIKAVLINPKRKRPVIKYEHVFDVKIEEAIYRNTPPKINGFHILSYPLSVDPENDSMDEEVLYFRGINTKNFKESKRVKYSAWKYEDEVRGILPYTSFRDGEAATRIVEVDSGNIIGIILGPNINRKDMQSCLRALEVLRSHKPRQKGFGSRVLAVLKAERQSHSLKLHVSPFAGLTPQNQMRKYRDRSHQLKPAHRKYLEELCLQINSYVQSKR